MVDLDQHYGSCAEIFLQTAIVIDDQAEFVPFAIPGPVIVPPQGLLDARAPAIVETPGATSPSAAAPLDAKALTEAFLDRKMICSLYRPSPGEEMVQRTILAAEAADVVVVDWHLEQGSSSKAKEIVRGLLRADQVEKGRLRLIAIYTAQSGREDIATELLNDLEASCDLSGSLLQEGPVLRNATTRIVVLNKRNTLAALDRDEVVPEANLPKRLVAEFAKLSRGILASFALRAVAAVRRGAHHMLALYTSDLDGAFVAHCCGIPNPDDAKTFALDMITSELRNLIEVADVPGGTLRSEIVGAWVDNLGSTGHTFQTDHVEVPADQVKRFVACGAKAVEGSKKKQRLRSRPTEPIGGEDEAHFITCGKLPRLFYGDAQKAQDGVRKLARLSMFQREPGRTKLPNVWVPWLTLGSLLQVSSEDGSGELLLCVQPRCDSVRLTKSTAFPFQTITRTKEEFNLVLRDVKGSEIEAWLNLKPKDARIIEFGPAKPQKMVVGSPAQDGHYYFTDAKGIKYAWLGDLKDMKAQRWAGELGSRVQSVGLEELEWLRWASERKIKRTWT